MRISHAIQKSLGLKKKPRNHRPLVFSFGGAKRDRTADLLNAIGFFGSSEFVILQYSVHNDHFNH